MDQHLLSIILLTPLAGLVVLLFIPGKSKDLIRLWANLVGFAGFLISLPLISRFQNGRPGFQFEERVEWIPTLGANYHIGIDGISLLLIMLTTLMGFIAVFCSWSVCSVLRAHSRPPMVLRLQRRWSWTGSLPSWLSGGDGNGHFGKRCC